MKIPASVFLRWGFVVLAVMPSAFTAAAQERIPVEEKTSLERELEDRVNQTVLAILGPNKAKVMLQLKIDFTRTEKLEIHITSAAAADFIWRNAGQKTQNAGSELLPGFRAASAANPYAGADETRAYSKKFIFPDSLVKQITATAIINKELPAAEAESVENFITSLLGIDGKRGDRLITIRVPFVPLWRTMASSPTLIEAAFKYGILALLGAIGIIIVAAAFLKLARALSNMAKAQEHQITMKLSRDAAARELPSPPAAPAIGYNLEEGGMKEIGAPAGGGGEKVFFSVRLEHVPFMAQTFAKEDPANVAVIAEHLKPALRDALLNALPSGSAAEVMASMAEARFVKPEVISALKEEIEKRFSGVVGGIEKLLESFEGVKSGKKALMLAELESRHPDIAQKVRSRVFLFEDMEGLGEKDLGTLAIAVKPDSWASVRPAIKKEFLERLRAKLSKKAWETIEQTVKYEAASPERLAAGREDIEGVASRLIKERRIEKPPVVFAGNVPENTVADGPPKAEHGRGTTEYDA